MACACLGCTNKRNYYLWLRDTLVEFGEAIPKVLVFDPYAVSNSKLDSAINRMLKLYRRGFVKKYHDPVQTTLDLDRWELAPFDWVGLKRKLDS